MDDKEPSLDFNPYVYTKQSIFKLSDFILDLDKPDRDIDGVVGRIFGWVQKCDPRYGVGAPHWWKDNKCNQEILPGRHHGDYASLPPFTVSVDAALTLFPKDVFVVLDTYQRSVLVLNGEGDRVGGRDCLSHYTTNAASGVVSSALRYFARTKFPKGSEAQLDQIPISPA